MIKKYALKKELEKDVDFNDRFSKVVRSVVTLTVYGLSDFSTVSAEKRVMREESAKATKGWAARELVRLNREYRFLNGYVDLKDEKAVDALLEDVYDVAIELVDVLNL